MNSTDTSWAFVVWTIITTIAPVVFTVLVVAVVLTVLAVAAISSRTVNQLLSGCSTRCAGGSGHGLGRQVASLARPPADRG